MEFEVLELGDVRVLLCAADGPLIANDRDAADLVGEALGAGAAMIALPLSRLSNDFLSLRTRVAGEILQKFVTYERRVAILGDVETAIAASDALRDFVCESNRGQWVWFLPDLAALKQRLEPREPDR